MKLDILRPYKINLLAVYKNSHSVVMAETFEVVYIKETHTRHHDICSQPLDAQSTYGIFFVSGLLELDQRTKMYIKHKDKLFHVHCLKAYGEV